MAPKKKKDRGYDVTSQTSFAPPPLSNTVVVPPPPSPPHGASVAAGGTDFPAAPFSLHQYATNAQQAATNDSQCSGGGNAQHQHQHQQQHQQHSVLFHHTTSSKEQLQKKPSSRTRRPPAGSGGSMGGGGGQLGGGGGGASDRLLYVLNTFQFVVSPTSLVPTVDPSIVKAMTSFDEFPDWSHICAVVQHAEYDEFKCPICLDTPLSPRMTLCGHVFCSACWISHAAERAAVAAKLAEKNSSSSSGLSSSGATSRDSMMGFAPATVRDGSEQQQQQVTTTTPCPICGKHCATNSTKPLLFVPTAPQKLDGTVVFSRVQRFRRAPVFFKGPAHIITRAASSSPPSSQPQQGRQQQPGGRSPASGGRSPTNNASATSVPGGGRSAQSLSPPSTPPISPQTTPPITPMLQSSPSSNAAGSAAALLMSPTSALLPAASVAGSAVGHKTITADFIPPLCVDSADEATILSRYVAFNAEVIETWSSRQLTSLDLAKKDIESNIAALVASGGADVAATERSPLVSALRSQLRSLDMAETLLLSELQMAASAPALPREFEFPALEVLDKSAENIVDLYHCVGSEQLFVHPIFVRMLQEDSMVRQQPIPDKITCHIDDVELFTQSDDQRKHRSFAHIPLGATYLVAMPYDCRSHISDDTLKLFEGAIQQRRENIRRNLELEAKKAAKQEELAAHVARVRAERDTAMLMQFGVRTDKTSTSVLDASEIATRNTTAFAQGLPEKNPTPKQPSNKKSSNNKGGGGGGPQFNVLPSNWRDNLPGLGDYSWSDNSNNNTNSSGNDDQQTNPAATSSATRAAAVAPPLRLIPDDSNTTTMMTPTSSNSNMMMTTDSVVVAVAQQQPQQQRDASSCVASSSSLGGGREVVGSSSATKKSAWGTLIDSNSTVPAKPAVNKWKSGPGGSSLFGASGDGGGSAGSSSGPAWGGSSKPLSFSAAANNSRKS